MTVKIGFLQHGKNAGGTATGREWTAAVAGYDLPRTVYRLPGLPRAWFGARAVGRMWFGANGLPQVICPNWFSAGETYRQPQQPFANSAVGVGCTNPNGLFQCAHPNAPIRTAPISIHPSQCTLQAATIDLILMIFTFHAIL